MKTRPYLLPALILILIFTCLSAFAIERSAIPDKYKWKLNDVFPTLESWQASFDSIRSVLGTLESYKGTIASRQSTDGMQNLIAFNKLNEKTSIALSHVYWQTQFHMDIDLSDPEWAGRQQQAGSLWGEYGEKVTWLEPELLSIPRDTLINWTNRSPELKAYQKQYSDMFALKSHSLSEKEEALLALASDIYGGPHEIFTQLSGVDLDFPKIVNEKGDSVRVGVSGMRDKLRSCPDHNIREQYFKTVLGRFDTFGNTFAATLGAHFKIDAFYSRAKKYENTLQSYLAPAFVPEEIYTNLIKTAKANLAPLHKYESIRKRMLGIDDYSMWDEYTALGSAEQKYYTWEDAADLVVDAVAPLGKSYQSETKKLLDPNNGWVDPFASENKLSGAMERSSLAGHTHIFFNFDFQKGLNIENVSTIAHEAGHSMRINYMQQTQPITMRSEHTLVAEVPSTLNEALFTSKLLSEARDDYKRASGSKKEVARQKLISVLNQTLTKSRDAFYRSTMFAAWELQVHTMAENGEPITKDALCKAFGDLFKEFYGPAMESNELTNIFWASYPHFYLGYYVYSYAIGEVAATALARDILAESRGEAGKRGCTERYINFLKAGSSRNPAELLRDAGVDMTTSKPIESYVRYITELVDELDLLTRPTVTPQK